MDALCTFDSGVTQSLCLRHHGNSCLTVSHLHGRTLVNRRNFNIAWNFTESCGVTSSSFSIGFIDLSSLIWRDTLQVLCFAERWPVFLHSLVCRRRLVRLPTWLVSISLRRISLRWSVLFFVSVCVWWIHHDFVSGTGAHPLQNRLGLVISGLQLWRDVPDSLLLILIVCWSFKPVLVVILLFTYRLFVWSFGARYIAQIFLLKILLGMRIIRIRALTVALLLTNIVSHFAAIDVVNDDLVFISWHNFTKTFNSLINLIENINLLTNWFKNYY